MRQFVSKSINNVLSFDKELKKVSDFALLAEWCVWPDKIIPVFKITRPDFNLLVPVKPSILSGFWGSHIQFYAF